MDEKFVIAVDNTIKRLMLAGVDVVHDPAAAGRFAWSVAVMAGRPGLKRNFEKVLKAAALDVAATILKPEKE